MNVKLTMKLLVWVTELQPLLYLAEWIELEWQLNTEAVQEMLELLFEMIPKLELSAQIQVDCFEMLVAVVVGMNEEIENQDEASCPRN